MRALPARTILRVAIATGVLISSLSIVIAFAQQGDIPASDPTCSPFGTTHLLGQSYVNPGLEPEYPIWCYAQRPAGPPTRILNGNTWTDSFDNSGPAIQTFRDGDYDYRVFAVSDAANPTRFKTGTFINSDHWMIDMVDISSFRLSGGILVSPNHTFGFQGGTFVVEADAAAGGDAMGGADAFYEMDVSPATAPTGIQADTLYGYGSFGGVGALGCRFERQADGPHAVCAMYDNSRRDAGGTDVVDHSTGLPGRVWETQGVGVANTARSVQGGTPDWPIPGTNLHVRDVWRQCNPGEHDLHCRDRFRLELTKDSVHLLVNGYPVYLIDGLYASNPATGADNRIPDSWLSSGVRPYFSSWINNGQHNPIRWHWNDVDVNPTGTPGRSISYCLAAPNGPDPNTCAHQHVPGQPEIGAAISSATVTPVPLATSTPVPTQAPTQTPVSTATPTATPTLTASATPTLQSTATPATVATDTPVPTLEATATPTETPQPTASATEIPTETPTPTPVSTDQPTATPTATSTVVATVAPCRIMASISGGPVGLIDAPPSLCGF